MAILISGHRTLYLGCEIFTTTIDSIMQPRQPLFTYRANSRRWRDTADTTLLLLSRLINQLISLYSAERSLTGDDDHVIIHVSSLFVRSPLFTHNRAIYALGPPSAMHFPSSSLMRVPPTFPLLSWGQWTDDAYLTSCRSSIIDSSLALYRF